MPSGAVRMYGDSGCIVLPGFSKASCIEMQSGAREAWHQQSGVELKREVEISQGLLVSSCFH